MDRLTSMAVFARCAELGSLAGAARSFGLSHAMVSKHVRALERQLGVRLLDVTTRRLGLTEAGRRYLPRCADILAQVDDAAGEASRYQSTPSGLLRLTAPDTFGRLHLAPALADFAELYPAITIDVAFTDRFVSIVDEGFDLAIRVGRLPNSSLIVRRLSTCGILTCASPCYLERFGSPGHPAELAAHTCLSLSTISTPGVWHYRDPAGGELHVDVKGPFQANLIDVLCRLAERGIGIVAGPSFVLGPSVQSGRLRVILAEFAPRPLDISAVLPSNRHLSTKVRVFLDFLTARFGGTPPWEAAP